MGAGLSGDGSHLYFHGDNSGYVICSPHISVKAGIHTFIVDILLPAREIPCGHVAVFRDNTVIASQQISTHCNTITIQAFTSVEGDLELKIYSKVTYLLIRRVTYWRGAFVRSPSLPLFDPEHLRQRLVESLSPDATPSLPSEWTDPKIVADALFGDNRFRIIPFQSLDEHESLWQHAGVMPAVIKAFFVQNNGKQSQPCTVPADDLVDGYPELTNSFQQGIISSGCLEVVSPYDGSLIRTQNSIPVPIARFILPIVYEFQGENPIVVGVGTGWAGSASFMWLVKHDIVVHDNFRDTDWSNPEQVISQYLAFCVGHADRLNDYRKSRHTVALASGFNYNMGHYFWNETSGLERVIRLTSLAGVQTIYSPRSRWLSMKEIFARDPLPPVVELDDWEDLAGEALDRNQILVHPAGTLCDDRLVFKIRRAAETRFAAEAPERWQSANDLTSKGQYVLYVNLRSHNKAWVEQDLGIIAIIRALRSVHEGEIVVYLDGWADCKESADAIAATPIDRVTYVKGLMGLHAGFPETLHWAFRCDFFVAVIGSGLVPVTWLANKPGICYGDSGHRHQMTYWQRVRNDMATISCPTADQIRDVSDQAYANYSIDPAIMVRLFLDLWCRLQTSAGV